MRMVPKGAVKNEDEEIETSPILVRESDVLAHLEEREGAADDSALRAGVSVAAAIMAVGEALCERLDRTNAELERLGNLLVDLKGSEGE